MPLNKEIITRVVIGIILFILFVKVVGPVILELLKKKIPGSYNPDNDIDSMIRRQKERLRAQYGLVERTDMPGRIESLESESTVVTKPATKEIENIYKEAKWGGGDFAKSIQAEITRNYSYTLAETKVHAFVLLSEKRNYLRFLSAENQKSNDAIKHYLSLVMLMLILIEEIRNREFNVLDRVAKKCKIKTSEMALAIQLKILFAISSKKPIKEEKLFEAAPTLHQYAEDTMKDALEIILKKEANLWAKGHSVFFEEMALFLNYADLMSPYPKFQSKTDTETAHLVLQTNSDMEMEDIKKAYKKLAMAKHPDKLGQMKLPKLLESKAAAKFNSIQEAFDIINKTGKK